MNSKGLINPVFCLLRDPQPAKSVFSQVPAVSRERSKEAARKYVWQILNTNSTQIEIPEVKLVAKKPAKKEAKKAAKKK